MIYSSVTATTVTVFWISRMSPDRLDIRTFYTAKFMALDQLADQERNG